MQIHHMSNLENYVLLILSKDKWSAMVRKSINSSFKENLDAWDFLIHWVPARYRTE